MPEMCIRDKNKIKHLHVLPLEWWVFCCPQYIVLKHLQLHFQNKRSFLFGLFGSDEDRYCGNQHHQCLDQMCIRDSPKTRGAGEMKNQEEINTGFVTLDIKPASVNLNENTGADGTILYYCLLYTSISRKLIFHWMQDPDLKIWIIPSMKMVFRVVHMILLYKWGTKALPNFAAE